jgi:hypothetical protein
LACKKLFVHNPHFEKAKASRGLQEITWIRGSPKRRESVSKPKVRESGVRQVLIL